VKNLHPDLFYESIYDINISRLLKMNIKGMIFDIDNTLVDYKTKTADSRLSAWLKAIESLGFKPAVVSNSSKSRSEIFAKDLGLSFFGNAKKPLRSGLLKAAAEMGLQPENIAMVGDQIFTDIWGAKRCKMLAILVSPISSYDPHFVRFKRKFEGRFVKKVKQNTQPLNS